jgi:sugar phosphate isomerase/epimerase
MGMTINSLPVGLAAYSFPWRCGWAGRDTGRVCTTPYTGYDLLDLAAQHDLSIVELPLQMLPDMEPETLQAFRARADELGLKIVAAGGAVDVATMERLIPAAAAVGAKVLRVVLSSLLEGARATMPGGWEAHLSEMIARLQQVRPLAEQYNICIAPENHQDATSDDLIRICEEVGGDCIGVTLDAVNPLAVGEHPLEFAQKLGSRIVDVHLKDYWIYLTPSGYRLVRCALGEGVLDLPALFTLIKDVAPHATCNIELAALYARHIRLFEDQWWEGYPPRDVRELLSTFRLVAQHARPADEDWRTPWEREAEANELGAYEEGQLARSVEYLQTLR